MSDQVQSNSSSDSIWLLASFIVALFCVWYFFGKNITFFYLNFKLVELKALSIFFTTEKNQALIAYIINHPLDKWKVKEIIEVGHAVGRFYNVPAAALLAFMTWKVLKKNPMSRFRRVHSIESLSDSEKQVWPFIVPTVGLNLLNTPPTEGKYAMAKTPYEFCVAYNLLDNPKDTNSLDKRKAEKLFSSQMGQLWNGYQRLPGITRCLFGIFAAQVAGEKNAASEALKKISSSAIPGKKPDFSAGLDLAEKYHNHEKVVRIMSKHAYVYTGLCQLLISARNTGPLPSNWFIWLRPLNRPLYYTLNAVGRQTSWAEIAGIFAHWKAEIIADHPIERPYVKTAVLALEKALGEIKIV